MINIYHLSSYRLIDRRNMKNYISESEKWQGEFYMIIIQFEGTKVRDFYLIVNVPRCCPLKHYTHDSIAFFLCFVLIDNSNVFCCVSCCINSHYISSLIVSGKAKVFSAHEIACVHASFLFNISCQLNNTKSRRSFIILVLRASIIPDSALTIRACL